MDDRGNVEGTRGGGRREVVVVGDEVVGDAMGDTVDDNDASMIEVETERRGYGGRSRVDG